MTELFEINRLYIENLVEGMVEDLECPHDVLLSIIEVIKGRVQQFRGGQHVHSFIIIYFLSAVILGI